MKVKPLADRVLIEPNPAEEKTAGGLFIPDTAKEKPLAGKVIAVGPGTADVKMEVKTGDQVLYGKYAGTEINIDGKDYLIMKQGDILAIIQSFNSVSTQFKQSRLWQKRLNTIPKRANNSRKVSTRWQTL